MNISIGILSYERTDLLLETIECLNKTEYPINLLVLNNNEGFCIKDEIVNALDSNITLEYIHDHVNYGVATGRDILLRKCKTKYLILFDDDVYIDDINKIILCVSNTFCNDEDISGIAFDIVEFSTKQRNRYEIPHKNKSFDMSIAGPTYLMIGAGHALDVTKAIKAGGYARDFGLYGFEEIDLSLRLINEGGRISYRPECEVQHKKSPDGRFSNVYVNKQGFINRSIMAKRHLKLRHFISCLVVRGAFLLYKTKSFKVLFTSLLLVLKDKKANKFGNYFYNYIKEVKGFIWY